MRIRIFFLILLLIVGTLLFSCGTNSAEERTQELDADAIRTQAVATFAYSLTETLSAVPPASPTRTQMENPSTPTAETPIPSPTTNPCFNLLYIDDVTIEDGTQMKAGEVFTKTWRVQNIGGCAWRPGFTFRHYGGDPMRGNTVTLAEAIPTGAIREISVQLVVPGGYNGVAVSVWRMADENGFFFGDPLTVEIIVNDPNAPTITPTP